jgi:hypothetical protein
MEDAIDKGSEPLREFMLKQTRERDLALFVSLGKLPQPNTPDDLPTYVLIPSFMISELKTAFQMGFLILLPFVVIDMVVSSALMSMGMMMLPPHHDLPALQGAPLRDGGRLVLDYALARDELHGLIMVRMVSRALPRSGGGSWGEGAVNELFVLEMGRNALLMTVMLAAPMMGAALLVGLIVSVFQALTQINEQTLTFVPRSWPSSEHCCWRDRG